MDIELQVKQTKGRQETHRFSKERLQRTHWVYEHRQKLHCRIQLSKARKIERLKETCCKYVNEEQINHEFAK